MLDCVTQNVHSLQHTYMSSSYRFSRLGLSVSHWDPYAVHRGSCLELYYCNMVEWFWCDSSLISTTNWFPSVLRYCWFGHPACKNRPQNDLLCVEWDVKPYTLTLTNWLLSHAGMLLHAMTGVDKWNRPVAAWKHVRFCQYIHCILFSAWLCCKSDYTHSFAEEKLNKIQHVPWSFLIKMGSCCAGGRVVITCSLLLMWMAE